MYSKMKLAVRGDNEHRYFSSNCGLLQGESTSPLIFSMFVNDLDSYLNDENVGVRVWDVLIKVLKFADDMAIFSKTSTTPSCSGSIPAQKSRGDSVLGVVFSHTMPKMDFRYSHRFS